VTLDDDGGSAGSGGASGSDADRGAAPDMSDDEPRRSGGSGSGAGQHSDDDGRSGGDSDADSDGERAPDHTNTRDTQGPAKRRKVASSATSAQELAAQEQAALRLLGGV
jgi:hypothetical protein